ncbi:hypothetical protein LEP1GSC137_4050 [Leptospira borgpetersenii str. Noumea 25]|uniref:Uncharacterized protein n=1 Tax=Leptospira borgpetersenii serovar Ballum TaxID=280505 RepID=A0A0S2ITS7_LEPBO|nr:hypothetical protein LBBP_02840 [Leptospira borgpetersenii serovar Ballum]EMO07954.1 hypothetical protein LEP1GSC137_4050 [Leptospira borgpetersenii str. Noumea 25]
MTHLRAYLYFREIGFIHQIKRNFIPLQRALSVNTDIFLKYKKYF